MQTFTNECGSGGGITGPTQFSGNIYFVNVNCINSNIYPGGDTERIVFLADGHIVRDLGPSTAHEILETLEQVTAR